jgi:hypothetical protein
MDASSQTGIFFSSINSPKFPGELVDARIKALEDNVKEAVRIPHDILPWSISGQGCKHLTQL